MFWVSNEAAVGTGGCFWNHGPLSHTKGYVSSVVLQLNLKPLIYLGSGCLLEKHLEAVQPYLLISHEWILVIRCWAENGVLDSVLEGFPEGFIPPAQPAQFCFQKGHVKGLGSSSFWRDNSFYWLIVPKRGVNMCHCSWPLRSRNRLGLCQACAGRQNHGVLQHAELLWCEKTICDYTGAITSN